MANIPNNHNGDPFWAEVAEIDEKLSAALRVIARGKKWEQSAARVNLAGVAQATLIVKNVQKQHESADGRDLRLSARAFERHLLALRERVAVASIFPAGAELMANDIDRDVQAVRAYAWPETLTAQTFIARAVGEAIDRVNQRDLHIIGAEKVPNGLGSTGVIVGLTCEALGAINRPNDPEAVRKALSKKSA